MEVANRVSVSVPRFESNFVPCNNGSSVHVMVTFFDLRVKNESIAVCYALLCAIKFMQVIFMGSLVSQWTLYALDMFY